MKKILIISPFFPPVNAADMHRIRQSISYYESNDWQAEIVTVDEQYVEGTKDFLLLKSIPSATIIHKVKAFRASITRRFGLGNIAYRSMYFYWKYVNNLLKKSNYDLIFFSTTAFPICALGRLWKRKFGIPYIIDMQDPWRSDHYLALPKSQRPPKFWISYKLDSYFEKFSMKKVDGLMAVSNTYIQVLKSRYSELIDIPSAEIPFAAYKNDIDLAKSIDYNYFFEPTSTSKNIVYVGRAGEDMVKANTIFLKAIKEGMKQHSEFENIKMYFIGTSYNPHGIGEQTVFPIADKLGIGTKVIESTNRIPYFESLKLLSEADILFVPGSDNIGYTASKIYSYAWLGKPLITLFHSSSSVNKFMRDCNAGLALQFDLENDEELIEEIIKYIFIHINNSAGSEINWVNFEHYTAQYKVKNQVDLFNKVITNGRR